MVSVWNAADAPHELRASFPDWKKDDWLAYVPELLTNDVVPLFFRNARCKRLRNGDLAFLGCFFDSASHSD
jgi:hypothetical protein